MTQGNTPISPVSMRARRRSNYLTCVCGSAWFRMVPHESGLSVSGPVKCRDCGNPITPHHHMK